MMGNDLRYFVNSKGDSVATDSVISSNAITTKTIDGFQYNYGNYFEIINLDSVLTITNYLEAAIKENRRQDVVQIKGDALQIQESVSAFGIASNANTLDSTTSIYHDTLVLNNTLYTNLYSTHTNNKLILYMSPIYSLVGFTLENDTFNLVN